MPCAGAVSVGFGDIEVVLSRLTTTIFDYIPHLSSLIWVDEVHLSVFGLGSLVFLCCEHLFTSDWVPPDTKDRITDWLRDNRLSFELLKGVHEIAGLFLECFCSLPLLLFPITTKLSNLLFNQAKKRAL